MTDWTSSELKKEYTSYENSQELIKSRRTVWLSKTRKQLQKILEHLIEANGIRATISTDEQSSNMLPIYLTLGVADSGLSKIEGSDYLLPFPKELGGILYTPIYNGKVSVVIKFPVIKGLMQAKEPQAIDICEPEEISREKVEKHLIQFFKMLIEWEDQATAKSNIGF